MTNKELLNLNIGEYQLDNYGYKSTLIKKYAKLGKKTKVLYRVKPVFGNILYHLSPNKNNWHYDIEASCVVDGIVFHSIFDARNWIII